jgi:hypothetical protein
VSPRDWSFAGVVTTVLVMLAKRPAEGGQFGSLSEHWLAKYRLDELQTDGLVKKFR